MNVTCAVPNERGDEMCSKILKDSMQVNNIPGAKKALYILAGLFSFCNITKKLKHNGTSVHFWAPLLLDNINSESTHFLTVEGPLFCLSIIQNECLKGFFRCNCIQRGSGSRILPFLLSPGLEFHDIILDIRWDIIEIVAYVNDFFAERIVNQMMKSSLKELLYS